MCLLKGLVNKGDNKMCGQLIARLHDLLSYILYAQIIYFLEL